MELVGTGINATYRRTPFEWMELIIDCITQLQQIIQAMETMDKSDSEYIINSILHIKRFYEELEREFFRSYLDSERNKSTGSIQPNISIHF